MTQASMGIGIWHEYRPGDGEPEALRRIGELIRCEECRYMRVWDVSSIYQNHEHDTEYCLRFVGDMLMTVERDGYCAWAEPKEDA